MTLIFFGSFQHYSAKILKSLIQSNEVEIVAVVTTPPHPQGRSKTLTPNPVHQLAVKHQIPVFTPSSLNSKSLSELKNILTADYSLPAESEGLQTTRNKSLDLFLTAGYGKLLPQSWLKYPLTASLNLHFSLLPSYRGANPAEWAILCGETQTGITLMQMDANFDTGHILSQTHIDIDPKDTRETLYEKLYNLGADCLPTMITQFVKDNSQFDNSQFSIGIPQPSSSPTPYARLLRRNDGFISWQTVKKIIGQKPLTFSDLPPICKTTAEYIINTSPLTPHPSTLLPRATRALSGYPTLWTKIPTKKGAKRMIIHSVRLTKKQPESTSYINLDTVQIEGQQPAQFNQIKNQIMN